MNTDNQTYIFQAALLCEDCADKVKRKLKRSSSSSSNTDDYPQGPYPDGGGEADSPQHCDHCQAPLNNPLTRDGIKYVLEALEDASNNRRNLNNHRTPTLDQWVASLSDYNLDPFEKATVERYEQPTTKVIFRIFYKPKHLMPTMPSNPPRKTPDPTLDVLALFPELLGTHDPYATCLSYAHIGQHGAASAQIIADTRPATPDEYKALKDELQTHCGYCLKVLKRFPRNATTTRVKTIKAITK